MGKEMLHGLIEMLSDSDTETIYHVLLKFIPEDRPQNDELRAIALANNNIAENGTVSHDSINWD